MNHFGRDGAEQELGQRAVSVRAHDDLIAAKSLGEGRYLLRDIADAMVIGVRNASLVKRLPRRGGLAATC